MDGISVLGKFPLIISQIFSIVPTTPVDGYVARRDNDKDMSQVLELETEPLSTAAPILGHILLLTVPAHKKRRWS